MRIYYLIIILIEKSLYIVYKDISYPGEGESVFLLDDKT